jgi:hypothetical protein
VTPLGVSTSVMPVNPVTRGRRPRPRPGGKDAYHALHALSVHARHASCLPGTAGKPSEQSAGPGYFGARGNSSWTARRMSSKVALPLTRIALTLKDRARSARGLSGTPVKMITGSDCNRR